MHQPRGHAKNSRPAGNVELYFLLARLLPPQANPVEEQAEKGPDQ